MNIYVNELEYWAAIGSVDRARLTILKGLDVNHASTGGYGPLHAAAENGHFPVIELLLRSGANPRALTDDGEKPSDLARKQGHMVIARRLEAAEARPN